MDWWLAKLVVGPTTYLDRWGASFPFPFGPSVAYVHIASGSLLLLLHLLHEGELLHLELHLELHSHRRW